MSTNIFWSDRKRRKIETEVNLPTDNIDSNHHEGRHDRMVKRYYSSLIFFFRSSLYEKKLRNAIVKKRARYGKQPKYKHFDLSLKRCTLCFTDHCIVKWCDVEGFSFVFFVFFPRCSSSIVLLWKPWNKKENHQNGSFLTTSHYGTLWCLPLFFYQIEPTERRNMYSKDRNQIECADKKRT